MSCKIVSHFRISNDEGGVLGFFPRQSVVTLGCVDLECSDDGLRAPYTTSTRFQLIALPLCVLQLYHDVKKSVHTHLLPTVANLQTNQTDEKSKRQCAHPFPRGMFNGINRKTGFRVFLQQNDMRCSSFRSLTEEDRSHDNLIQYKAQRNEQKNGIENSGASTKSMSAVRMVAHLHQARPDGR